MEYGAIDLRTTHSQIRIVTADGSLLKIAGADAKPVEAPGVIFAQRSAQST